MKSNYINKTGSLAILDIFQQQQNIINAYNNPLNSVAALLAASTALSKMSNIATSRTNFNPVVMGLPSYINDMKNSSKRFNSVRSILGFSNLDILLRQISHQSLNTNFQSIFSPALQIQKSLSSLYSTKNAFADYNNLYGNTAFWNQFKELQTVISAIPKALEYTELEIDNDFSDDLIINNVFAETNTIAETIDKTKTVTYEDFEALKSKVDAIYSFITNPNNKKSGIIYTLIIFILFKFEPLFNDIVQQIQYYHDVKTNVSHDDIKELSFSFQQSMAEMRNFIVKYEFRYAKRPCFLRLKSNTKSQKLYRINKGDNLIVLHANKQWLFITIVDRTDGAQISGWVQKKLTKKIEINR